MCATYGGELPYRATKGAVHPGIDDGPLHQTRDPRLLRIAVWSFDLGPSEEIPVKPDDRALDIAVIGLGQGGGNLAAQFADLGYRVIALNTALTDLSVLGEGTSRTVLKPEQRVYIGIDGYDGAGGDLNYGRECIRENADRIRKAVTDHALNADVVLLAAGLGGGTGSAASELVRTVEDLNLPIVVMATLPTEHESGMAKVNAVRGASALVKLEGLSWIFVDNSRLARRHSDVSMDRYYDTINAVIVSPLDALNRINHATDMRPIRTLDGEDLRRLLLSGGIINYASDQLAMLEVGAVSEKIREALESSSIMPSGYAFGQVATIGIVIQAPEEMLANTPFSFFERLNEHVKESTSGAACYLGVYRTRARGSLARLRLVCSSHQVPDGIVAMVNDARREGSVLRDKLQQTLSPLDLGEIEEFDLFRTSLRTGPGIKGRRKPPVLPDLSDEGLDISSGMARPLRKGVGERPSALTFRDSRGPLSERPAPSSMTHPESRTGTGSEWPAPSSVVPGERSVPSSVSPSPDPRSGFGIGRSAPSVPPSQPRSVIPSRRPDSSLPPPEPKSSLDGASRGAGSTDPDMDTDGERR